MRIVVFMISLLVFSAALSEGRPWIPGSSGRLPGPPANRIPSEAEVTSTHPGCCSAANLYDVPEPRGAVTSDKLEPGTRTMNPTAGNTTHTMTPATTTYTTELITESSPVEVTLETSHRLQRAHHRATTTATTVMLEESIKYLPVQLVVALVTAFLAATALSAILSVAVFAASSAISLRMPRRNRSLSGSKARLTTLQCSLLGRPAHVRLPDLEEAEGLLCPTTTVYIDDEPPRDESDSSLQDTTALEEKSLLLLACQGELECLKAKLATAEASLETSSLENTTLRSTLAETKQDLHETKQTSERREAQLQEKNGLLSQAIKEHDRLQFQADIMALENRRQEEELLDAQDDLSALSNELLELSEDKELLDDDDLDMSFQEWL